MYSGREVFRNRTITSNGTVDETTYEYTYGAGQTATSVGVAAAIAGGGWYASTSPLAPIMSAPLKFSPTPGGNPASIAAASSPLSTSFGTLNAASLFATGYVFGQGGDADVNIYTTQPAVGFQETFVTTEGDDSSLNIKQDITVNDNFFERAHYGLKYCLGRSDILKTDAPAWTISMLRGEIADSQKAITGSNVPTVHIPQVKCNFTYKINTVVDRQFISDTELAVQYPNGEYLDVKPEILLSQIIERNAEFTKENFDIEVFEVTSGSFTANDINLPKDQGSGDLEPAYGTIEELRPLKFKQPYSLVQNDILLDEDEVAVADGPLTNEYVEYYFYVKVDNKIDEQLICSSLADLKSKGLYVDAEIECKETKNIALVDIYTTDAALDPCPDLDNPCEDGTEPGTLY